MTICCLSIDDVICMFINKPHARDWIDDIHELTQIFLCYSMVYPCIIECVVVGFLNHLLSDAEAHCRAIFCSDDLSYPAVTSAVASSISVLLNSKLLSKSTLMIVTPVKIKFTSSLGETTMAEHAS